MTSLIYWGLAFALALIFGHLARKFRLPRLIGYVVGGFIIGPSVSSILPEHFMQSIKTFEELTLAFILFLIGTMMRFDRLHRLGVRFLKPAFIQVFGTFLLVYLCGVIFLPGFIWPIMLATIAMATAPAATAMIIEEYSASGPLTDSVIASVVFDNFLVITLFYLFLPIVLGSGFLQNLEKLVFSLLGSIALGIVFGLIFCYFETKIEGEEFVFSVSLSLLVLGFGIAIKAHLFLFLVALFFGITARNASLRNMRAIKTLKLLDFPIYALFFTIAGAALHVKILLEVRYFVLLYILSRFLGKWLGASLGARWGDLDVSLKRYLGLGIVSHAGLATGLALYLGRTGVPSALYIMNIVLASTVFFELVGPILLKEVLVKAGEVKVLSIIRGGVSPVFDIEFQTVLRSFVNAVGLPDPFRSKFRGEVNVSHILKRHFISINPKQHLDQIIKAFEKAHCSALPVADEESNYHGVLLLCDIEALILDPLTSRLIVAEDVIRQIPGVKKDESLKRVFEMFRELKIDTLPVVENNKVLGVVMRKDVLATLGWTKWGNQIGPQSSDKSA